MTCIGSWTFLPLTAKDGSVRGYMLLDSEDAERFPGPWRMQEVSPGYRYAIWQGKLLHRLIVDAPKGMEADHVNHDTLDNRRCNLRLCTHAQNQQNRTANGDRDTSSQYRGVSWYKQGNKWRAYIELDDQFISLGYYDDEEDAHKAAADARRRLMPFSQEGMQDAL